MDRYSCPVDGSLNNHYVPIILSVKTLNAPELSGPLLRFIYVLRSLGMYEFWVTNYTPNLAECINDLNSWAITCDPDLEHLSHDRLDLFAVSSFSI